MLDRMTQQVRQAEIFSRECTPTRVFEVRLHSMGLSVREVVAVFELIGVDRSHGAVWNWTPDSLKPRLTRRRQSRRGSRSMRNKSELMVKRNGCTQRLIQNRSYCWKSTYTAAAGPIPRRRFSTSDRETPRFGH